MGSTSSFLRDPWATLELVGTRRLRCGSLGASLIAVGLVAMATPLSLFGSILKVVGALLIGAAALEATQLWPGGTTREGVRRGWPIILGRAALDLALGVLLILHIQVSMKILVASLGLLFVADGMVLLVMAVRSPTVRSRLALWVAGLVTAALGIFIVFRLDQSSIVWAGFLVGLKLFLFGLALIWIAASAPSSDAPLVFEPSVPEAPLPAELYAVYFGTAFHLGVYVGDGRVVHYTDANLASEVSWERFLDGRSPMFREYPDLPVLPPDEVIRYALDRVGNTSKYSLISNNCEHFALECKSCGATRYSKYAQIPISLENAASYPWMGTAVELYSRVIEWIAFNLGGAFGKKVALEVRRTGGMIAAWMLTRRLDEDPPASSPNPPE